MTKPALLLISATYVVDENRKKLDHLATLFDLACVTCTEARSLGFDVTLQNVSAPRSYRLVGLRTIGGADTNTRFLFENLGEVFERQRFDLILVEAEPWAWVRWQAWWWKRRKQRGALFGEFSWENVVRSGWRGVILPAIYRAAVQTTNFVIAGNRNAGDLFLRAGLPRSRLLVAPQLGVDEQRFQPLDKAVQRHREGVRSDAFVVGFCGRFVEEKGVLDLVAAMDIFRAHQPTQLVELVMLGAGPLKGELERLARERPWVRLLPPRPHTEVAPFMQMLDLFILPSKPQRDSQRVWEEQFGHVLIEAMACGVACLGSDSGAIPQVIGEPGAVFPAGDRAELSERIAQLAQDAVAREELARRQRSRTLSQFTDRVLAGTWATFLKDLLR